MADISGIRSRLVAAAGIPTPPTGSVHLFFDVADATAKFKDSTGTVYTLPGVDPSALKKANNLSDLTDVAQARINLGITGSFIERAGSVNGTLFTGNPKTYNVVFSTPLVDNNYSVAITGADGRIWTVTNITNTGFVINANANTPFTGEVYWVLTEKS